MPVLLSESGARRVLAILLLVVVLPACGTETDDPASVPEIPKNDLLELETAFAPQTLEQPVLTCIYTAAKAAKYTCPFSLDTKAGGQGCSSEGVFRLSCSSRREGDSFRATLSLDTHNSVMLVPKSAFISITVAQGETTIPHDSPLPAGKFTVVLTGKMPQPPAGEPKDDGSEG